LITLVSINVGFKLSSHEKKIISLRRPRRRKPHIEGRAPKTHDVNHTTVMSSNATRTTDTPTVGDAATPAHHIDAEEAFPGLPQDVVTHILRSDSDPIVLARLRAVNRAKRDAVDQTGLRVEEMTSEEAAELGCLDTLQLKLEKGRLNKRKVCEFAVKGGQLEVLQWLRANGCPWGANTCSHAAEGGHLEVLQWARANDCPWNEYTCMRATEGGHLEVPQWARANGCPWD
jgi:hypothetical protein|tara:strand:- start:1296 stop:1985 length:690 start_codon:yes stop_codon:yes gene_type:complete